MNDHAVEAPQWVGKSVEDDFTMMLTLLEDEDEIRLFLAAFLTKRELFLIACRMRATWLLFDGFNTQKVRQLCSKKPKISFGVISRANTQLAQDETNNQTYKNFFERLKQHQLDKQE